LFVCSIAIISSKAWKPRKPFCTSSWGSLSERKLRALHVSCLSVSKDRRCWGESFSCRQGREHSRSQVISSTLSRVCLWSVCPLFLTRLIIRHTRSTCTRTLSFIPALLAVCTLCPHLRAIWLSVKVWLTCSNNDRGASDGADSQAMIKCLWLESSRWSVISQTQPHFQLFFPFPLHDSPLITHWSREMHPPACHKLTLHYGSNHIDLRKLPGILFFHPANQHQPTTALYVRSTYCHSQVTSPVVSNIVDSQNVQFPPIVEK